MNSLPKTVTRQRRDCDHADQSATEQTLRVQNCNPPESDCTHRVKELWYDEGYNKRVRSGQGSDGQARWSISDAATARITAMSADSVRVYIGL